MCESIDRLAVVRPGPELGVALAAVDPATLSAHELVVVAVARQRQLAHEEAAQLRVFAELAARPEYQRCDAPDDLAAGHVHRAVQAAGDEVSLATRWTPGRATGQVALAVELLQELPDTFEALEAGRIDADKARLIAERTRCLPDTDLRHRVETAVLPVAEGRTRWVLDQRLRSEVITADPAGAEDRRRQAADRRCVGRPEPGSPGGDDGTATMTLYGPAEDVIALWVATDAAARHARCAGDDRGLDQLRFDLLTGLAWTALESGHLGCCNPSCNPTCTTAAAPPPAGANANGGAGGARAAPGPGGHRARRRAGRCLPWPGRPARTSRRVRPGHGRHPPRAAPPTRPTPGLCTTATTAPRPGTPSPSPPTTTATPGGSPQPAIATPPNRRSSGRS
ncbi:DUF222 domain-containing protein [Jiangella alkaliphila]|uniref:DUF222 domain-containing protein n=1 Tax=Jiangella alkaliphila TaxID=419479 RepID=UPI001364C02D|nr:DUF222 domain-containing protein [Jiangella alkaliphila]